MKKFEEWMEKYLLPLANKLNTVKGLIAVRDSFLQIFPLTLVASIATMINVVFLSPTGFVGQYLARIWPNIDSAQVLLSRVSSGSLDVMALFIVFLIAKNMCDQYRGDSTKAGMTALASFFILYVPAIDGSLTTTYFGANGIFVSIIVGLIVGYLFYKLTQIDALKIKLPDNVPPEVMKSFLVALPTGILIVSASILSWLISYINPDGINAIIYSMLQAPFAQIGTSPITPMILITVAVILWVFGIHGTNTVSPIYLSIYSAINIANIDYVSKAGTAFGAPYPYSWFSLFENYGCIGGTGNTLALVCVILLLSKRKNWKRADYTQIAKLSLIPGLFCINEPVIFGLPIVLNPILAIPFILSPIISMGLGALMIKIGFAAPGILDVGWTTPQPLKTFLQSSGSWGALVSVIIVFIVSMLIYLPFVIMANKQGSEETK